MSINNHVSLIGRLGKDPVEKVFEGGNKVVNFSLATQETWTKKDGSKGEKTEWHNIVIWGGLAKVASDYLKKGSEIALVGYLKTRSYENNQGSTTYVTEVIVNEFKITRSRPSTRDQMIEDSTNEPGTWNEQSNMVL